MCRLGFFGIDCQGQFVKETLRCSFRAEVGSMEVQALTESTCCIFRTFSRLIFLCLEILRIDPLNHAKDIGKWERFTLHLNCKQAHAVNARLDEISVYLVDRQSLLHLHDLEELFGQLTNDRIE